MKAAGLGMFEGCFIAMGTGMLRRCRSRRRLSFLRKE